MLVYKHSSHPLPSPRRDDRSNGARSQRRFEALDIPVQPQPLEPEAIERAKASRERYARRRPKSALDDDTETTLLYIGVVVALLVGLFWIGVLLTL